MNFKAKLPFPPSVNHYWRHGRNSTYLSAKGREYRAEVLQRIKSPVVIFPKQRLAVTVFLHPDNRRKYDVDNRLKGLLDALEKARIYSNDEQIDDLRVVRGKKMEKGRACCVVEIEVINGR